MPYLTGKTFYGDFKYLPVGKMGVFNFSILFNMVGIYKITNPKGRVYVGQSVDIQRRWYSYKITPCKGQPRLYSSIKKYGYRNHIFETLEECSVENLDKQERYWQEFYNVLSEKGLNCKLTKTEDRSGNWSEQSKKCISDTMKKMGHRPPSREGQQGYWKGKIKPTESNQKTSEKLKGTIRGPKSESSKKLQSQSMLGRVPWNKGKSYVQGKQRKGIKVVNILTGKIYESIKEASLIEQVSRDVVIYSCKKLLLPLQYHI